LSFCDGENAAAGEARLLTIADELAANPRVDAWAVGLFNLQRLAADTRRARKPQLAAALAERMQRIDPDFTPNETTTASVSTENVIVSPPITAHVATVRHRMSVSVNSQIANRQATTATRRHRRVIQKASPRIN